MMVAESLFALISSSSVFFLFPDRYSGKVQIWGHSWNGRNHKFKWIGTFGSVYK